MGLVERIDGDLKSAMKAREAPRVSALRMLKARLKNREIEKGESLTDEDVVAAASSMIKQMRDSVEQYEKAGRADLARKEHSEIEIVSAYMPAQLSGEEVEKAIKEAVAEAQASSPGDMGKVMKLVMPRLKGKADGKLINETVKRLLGG